MTVQEYIDIMVENDFIEKNRSRYSFTKKGLKQITTKCPNYPVNWYYAIDGAAFWGISPNAPDMYSWKWYYSSDQDIMEYVLKEIFEIDNNPDYIELNDIVL